MLSYCHLTRKASGGVSKRENASVVSSSSVSQGMVIVSGSRENYIIAYSCKLSGDNSAWVSKVNNLKEEEAVAKERL